MIWCYELLSLVWCSEWYLVDCVKDESSVTESPRANTSQPISHYDPLDLDNEDLFVKYKVTISHLECVSLFVYILLFCNDVFILANCNNSWAYTTVLCPYVCCLSVCNFCIVAKWCVLPKKLCEEANRKWPIGIELSCDQWHGVTLKGQACHPNMLRAQHVEAGDAI